LKGFVENLEQFDVLLGKHQTVSHNAVVKNTETGFGGVVSDPFNLNFVKLIGQIPNVLIKVNDILVIYNLFFIEGILHFFKNVKKDNLGFFELFDLNIQQPFMLIAGVHIGAQDDVPVAIRQLLQSPDRLGIFKRYMGLLFLK
jgi:hypothetical protein